METQNARQALFVEVLLGTLLYSVVLGFFNDYTDILATRSYSVTFELAFVMQILTSLTLGLKRRVEGRFEGREGARHKVALGLSIWAIMFLSKFVFLAVIDRWFGDAVRIDGFVGIIVVIVTMMVFQQLVTWIYRRLGDAG